MDRAVRLVLLHGDYYIIVMCTGRGGFNVNKGVSTTSTGRNCGDTEIT
jgi:hypothetical protein